MPMDHELSDVIEVTTISKAKEYESWFAPDRVFLWDNGYVLVEVGHRKYLFPPQRILSIEMLRKDRTARV